MRTGPHSLILALVLGSSAAAAPGAVTLKPGFRPNPLIVDGIREQQTTWGGADYPFFRCPFTGYTSRQPVYTFTVEGTPQRVRMVAGGTWLVVQNEAREYWCGQAQDRDTIDSTLDPGRYSVYFVNGSARDQPRPAPVSLIFDDVKRPITFAGGGRTVDVPAHPTEPIVIDGVVAAQPEPNRGWCEAGHFGREPDFFLRSAQPVADLELSVVWSPKRQALRILTPSDPRRPHCPTNGSLAMTYDLFEGLYAVWVGDAKSSPGAPYRVLVTTRDMKLDALATFTRPAAGLTLAQRQLAHHYRGIGRFKGVHESKRAQHDDLIRRLFLEAPKELFVFVRVDLSDKQVNYDGGLSQWHTARIRDSLPELHPAPPRAGEPLLVLSGSGDFITADGELVSIDKRLVQLDPPVGPPAVPRAPRITEAPSAAALDLAESDEPKKRQAFTALSDKAQKCYIGYMEKHNRSGDARSFEVVTRSGGREISTENLADRLARQASATCQLDRLEKERTKLTATLATARTKRRTTDLSKIDERLRTLFPPDVPRPTPTPPQPDEENEPTE